MPDLWKTRRFLPLFLTQFFGAFNDNLFKNALVMLIAYKLAAQTGGNAQMLVTLAAALFILPYLLFSATAGQLADKMDRARLSRLVKLAEIGLMALAAVGFYADAVYFLLFVLFCMGVQATFFGPIKYALLPQHLHEDELIAANAWIEAATFLAILIGTIAGGLFIMREGGAHLISGAMLLVAGGGYAASRFIPPAPPPMPGLAMDWNIARATWEIVRNDRKNPKVFASILGISWFWLVGATLLSQFPTYARDVVHGDETVVTLFLTVFSLGIGVGSLLCNRLLKGEVNSRFVPWAAAGMTLFVGDLFFAHAQGGGGLLIDWSMFLGSTANWQILFDLLAAAACGGIYIVPLYAIMQHDSDPACRARTIASNNVLNALFMVASAVATMLMLKEGFSVPQVFGSLAVANGFVALWIVKRKL